LGGGTANSMKKSPRWMSLAGQGFELTAAVIGFGLAGYWVGGHLGNASIGLLVGALLGIFGGLYNLIHSSLRTIEKQEQDQSESVRDD
jgi:F0F1-type ATP synthase assembly protein I